MENLKKIVGENLAELRKNKKLTQLELAEKFNYSDKAISKWETGDTLPELDVLYSLCEFYGVTLDYLTTTKQEDKSKYIKDNKGEANNVIITCLIGSVVWGIVTMIYVYLFYINNISFWPVFILGFPATAIVLSILNRIYFKSRLFYFIVWSVFVWGSILSAFTIVIFFNPSLVIWPLFLLGIPTQISLVLWYLAKKRTR